MKRNPNDPAWFDPNTWVSKDGAPWTEADQEIADRIWAKTSELCPIYWKLYQRWTQAPEASKGAYLQNMTGHVRQHGCRLVDGKPQTEEWIFAPSQEVNEGAIR